MYLAQNKLESSGVHSDGSTVTVDTAELFLLLLF